MKLRDHYQQAVRKFQPKPSYLANSFQAFISGGLVCAGAEGLRALYMNSWGFSSDAAQHLMMLTVMGLAVLLTAMGRYDALSQFAGAGATVLLTGFANSLASAAMEHRTEGWVSGIANHMFKIGGVVIVYGMVIAYVLGVIYYIV
ncbi:hypothetical protein AT864_00221 [Anoxybacillus sp. P3H1B]|uniref:SpoVA/SpoVAEb family sporulation membrane protein n=1 Tax=Anoxybacillaceae TaxID=3120669 RepID=UPI0007914CFF|nr:MULTISPECIES: SpoVA/SpoVAEb family sporulation membrane protein [Anoxybacillus]KXG11138.1 hypothetical protein AT864_00221 [Anoxybacillus sp. P3H1B]MBB3906715.1 stage V sporulation protein AC [Anoxybacillus rupiensis]